MKLLEHAPDDNVVGCVGAGPLETFVSDDADDLFWIESQARSNPRLRSALAGMWVAHYVTEATLVRLDRAAGTALPRPLPRDEWPPAAREYDDALDMARRHLGDNWWDHIGDDDLSPAQDAAMRRMLAAIDRMSAMADRDDAEDDQGS